MAQGLSLEQLGHQERDAALVADVVNGQDVGVRERRDRLGLALETSEPAGVVGSALRQDLDRHLAIEPRVSGAIHLAHATSAERREDLVGGEPRTRSE